MAYIMNRAVHVAEQTFVLLCAFSSKPLQTKEKKENTPEDTLFGRPGVRGSGSFKCVGGSGSSSILDMRSL